MLVSKFHSIEDLTYSKSSLSRCGSAAFHLKHCTNGLLSSQIKDTINNLIIININFDTNINILIIINALVEYQTFNQINLAARGLNCANYQMLPQTHCSALVDVNAAIFVDILMMAPCQVLTH